MTKKEKQTVKEVMYATRLHLAIVENNLKHKARIGKDTLVDMADGMAISLSKLNHLIVSK